MPAKQNIFETWEEYLNRHTIFFLYNFWRNFLKNAHMKLIGYTYYLQLCNYNACLKCKKKRGGGSINCFLWCLLLFNLHRVIPWNFCSYNYCIFFFYLLENIITKFRKLMFLCWNKVLKRKKKYVQMKGKRYSWKLF